MALMVDSSIDSVPANIFQKASMTVASTTNTNVGSTGQVAPVDPKSTGAEYDAGTPQHWVVASLQALRQLRSIGLLAAGRLSIVLASVISVRLMTMVLSPGEVGRYSVLLAFATWFSLTLVSPAGNYINRRFLEWVGHAVVWPQLRRYMGLLLAIAFAAAGVSSVARNIGLLGLPIRGDVLILCVVGILVFLTANTMLADFLNVLGHRGLYVVYASATAWLGLVTSVLLTRVVAPTAELWIAGQVIGWMALSAVGYISLKRCVAKARIVVPTPPLHEQGLWAFVWPLIISTSFYWFQVQGYRIELEHWVGIASVGLLTTGLLLGATPITTVETLLGEYFRPRYFQAIACDDRRVQEVAWREMAEKSLMLLIPTTMLIGFSGSFLATLLVGPSFRSAASLVGWGALVEFLRAVNSLYGMAAYTRFQTRTMLRPSIVSVMIVLVVIGPLAHWDLYKGTGCALVLAMAASTIYLPLRLRHVFDVTIGRGDIIRAVIYSAPISISLFVAHVIIKHPALGQAVLVLGIAGVLTLGAQLLLNRARATATAVMVEGPM